MLLSILDISITFSQMLTEFKIQVEMTPIKKVERDKNGRKLDCLMVISLSDDGQGLHLDKTL